MNDPVSKRFEDIWYESADGLQLYARRYSAVNAPRGAVLCMHGLTRNSADFAELAKHLQTGYDVICADQRGRGRSDYDSDSSHYQPAVYVQDMFKLLDHLQLDDVVLIGTSMGGLMAMAMAAMHPERVRAITLNDIGPEVDPTGLKRIMAYAGKMPPVNSWAEAVEQTRAVNAIAFPNYNDNDWQRFASKLYVENESGVPTLAYDPSISTPIASDDSAAVPADLWPVFESLSNIPLLAIRGASSDILSSECIARMKTIHPGMGSVEVPKRGHAPMLDEPEAIQAIDAFLSQTASSN